MQALVLETIPYREHDQLVSVLTQEKGKMRMIARGSKKITSKNAAHLEPCLLVDIGVVAGKSYDTLTYVHPEEVFRDIRTSVYKSLQAQHAMKALDQLLKEGSEEPEIFQFALEWLRWLSEADDLGTIPLDFYYIRLVSLLGFAPDKGKISLPKREKETVLQWISDGPALPASVQEVHAFAHGYVTEALERYIPDWKSIENAPR